VGVGCTVQVMAASAAGAAYTASAAAIAEITKTRRMTGLLAVGSSL
jgi:hypothetical protein